MMCPATPPDSILPLQLDRSSLSAGEEAALMDFYDAFAGVIYGILLGQGDGPVRANVLFVQLMTRLLRQPADLGNIQGSTLLWVIRSTHQFLRQEENLEPISPSPAHGGVFAPTGFAL